MSTVPDELQSMRPTWADIDVAAFRRNIEAVASRLPHGSRLIAVMKANAYGHGAAELARHVAADRVAMIATVMLEEAMELRRTGIKVPLLVLGPLNEAQVREAVENEIVIGIPGPEELEIATRVARERDVHIHLKLDSGMGRMGSTEEELPAVIALARTAPRLHIDAIYTHFANSSDPHDPYTEEQSKKFDRMVAALREAGITAPLHHRANSGATMRGVIKPGEFVRVGLALYGAEAVDVAVTRLEPVMRWRTEIARLKNLPAGHPIGYGMTYRTRRPSRIATLPVGYADGYNRLLSNKGDVLIRGQRARVVGRVSMDLITVDVTDVIGAALGDEAVLLGSQHHQTITPEDLANKTGTISYEVFCSVGARVPRVYRDGDRVIVRSRFK